MAKRRTAEDRSLDAIYDPRRKPKTAADWKDNEDAAKCDVCAEASEEEWHAELKKAYDDPGTTTQGDVYFWARVAFHRRHLRRHLN